MCSSGLFLSYGCPLESNCVGHNADSQLLQCSILVQKHTIPSLHSSHIALGVPRERHMRPVNFLMKELPAEESPPSSRPSSGPERALILR